MFRSASGKLALSDTNVYTFSIVRSFCKYVLYCEPGSVADGVCESIAVAEITSCEAKHFS